MFSITKHSIEGEHKSTLSKNPLILTKPYEENPVDLGGAMKQFKNLSNEIVDMKKKYGEGYSIKKFFEHFIRKNTTKPSPQNMICLLLI